MKTLLQCGVTHIGLPTHGLITNENRAGLIEPQRIEIRFTTTGAEYGEHDLTILLGAEFDECGATWYPEVKALPVAMLAAVNTGLLATIAKFVESCVAVKKNQHMGQGGGPADFLGWLKAEGWLRWALKCEYAGYFQIWQGKRRTGCSGPMLFHSPEEALAMQAELVHTDLGKFTLVEATHRPDVDSRGVCT